jgi:sulfite reductase alpha subunit-like flavoprotein
MSKTKEDYQKEATELGIALEKDGKELTVEELKAEIKEKKPASGDKKKVKVKFVKSPSGRFLLPYNVGQTVEIDPEQAKELIEGGFAEKA